MSHKDIFDMENRNDASDLFKMKLIIEGIWCRAYEWSAFLMMTISKMNVDVKDLTPIKKKSTKNKSGIIMVGIPISSLAKYLPTYFASDDDISKIATEKEIVLDVSDSFIESGITFEQYNNKLEEWKSSVQIADKKQKQENNSYKNVINDDLTNDFPLKNEKDYTYDGLIKMILLYEIENNSLINNVYFLQELRKYAINI